jgi:hypothetical protein
VAEDAFLDEYILAQEGSPVRVYLERLHGKGNLARLIKARQEDRANAAWLDGRSSGSIASQVCLLISDAETTACPSCHVHIERSAGCDHVCSLFGVAYCVTYAFAAVSISGISAGKCSTRSSLTHTSAALGVSMRSYCPNLHAQQYLTAGCLG